MKQIALKRLVLTNFKSFIGAPGSISPSFPAW